MGIQPNGSSARFYYASVITLRNLPVPLSGSPATPCNLRSLLTKQCTPSGQPASPASPASGPLTTLLSSSQTAWASGHPRTSNFIQQQLLRVHPFHHLPAVPASHPNTTFVHSFLPSFTDQILAEGLVWAWAYARQANRQDPPVTELILFGVDRQSDK